MRKKRLFSLAVGCVLIAVIVFFDPIRSIVWHCIHGNYVTIADKRIKVPLLWRRVSAVDASDETLRLKKSTMTDISGGTVEGIGIRQMDKNQPRTKEDYEAAFNKLATSGKIKTMTSEIFTTPLGSFFCFKSVGGVNPVDMFCSSPDLQLQWSFMGSPQEMTEAETIMKTLQRIP